MKRTPAANWICKSLYGLTELERRLLSREGNPSRLLLLRIRNSPFPIPFSPPKRRVFVLQPRGSVRDGGARKRKLGEKGNGKGEDREKGRTGEDYPGRGKKIPRDRLTPFVVVAPTENSRPPRHAGRGRGEFLYQIPEDTTGYR